MGGSRAEKPGTRRAPPPRGATEDVHPDAGDLHRLDALSLVRRIAREDRRVAPAVAREAPAVARVVERVVAALSGGGRLLYVGAGTSGRLGVLDASECRPTFGVGQDCVTGILAGGPAALTRAREGAEDDRGAGARAMDRRRVGPRDFVLGITASGCTPYVLAALRRARERGAGTGILSCSPPPASCLRDAGVSIQPRVGPEIVAGSTRMKAGTATKLVLNQITTAAMIRLGHVHAGLMVDLSGGSRKLRRRAEAIVAALAGLTASRARRLLQAAGGEVRTAVVMGRHGVGAARARAMLEAAGGALARVVSPSRSRSSRKRTLQGGRISPSRCSARGPRKKR